ncbi:hypothetical protein ScPMuIL_008182 [Solemya velum]
MLSNTETKSTPKSNKPVLRTRTKYSPQQLEALERVFGETQYPDTDTMEHLADRMGITMERISVWFQNRRSKFKRQSKDNRVTWMRSQIFKSGVTSVPPTQDNRKQNKHVLSPPERSIEQHVTKPARENPKMNLHHMPDIATQLDSLFEYSQVSNPSDLHPTTLTELERSTSGPGTSFPITNTRHQPNDPSLQLSHLLNDFPNSPLFSPSPLPSNQSMFPFPHTYNHAVQYYQGGYPQYRGLVSPSV